MRRILLSLGALSIAALTALPPASSPARAQQESRPNILIIMSDDQRPDTMEAMPRTLRYFSKGTTFTNAYATTPLCCPSRASIFTGRYAHNHGVQSNRRGEARLLDQTTTLQYHLQQAGYRTAIFGKYLNGWDVITPPPFFDEYAITKRRYYNARFGIGRDGTHSVKEIPWYSTSYITRKALGFVNRAEVEDSTPWLMYVTPYAPHDPAIAPPRYRNAPVSGFVPDPALLEKDLSDKPPQYQSSATYFNRSRVEARRRKQLRSLMPVDDLVQELTEALEGARETNTLVFYMSDNGYMFGEHGLTKKGVPYQPSVRIPMMFRWKGEVAAGTDERLAANIDVAPTAFDAADVEPQHKVDGKSLLEAWDRDELLAEVYADRTRPDLWWASVISRDFQYVEYYGGDGQVPVFREYYNLAADPWQLTNLLADDSVTNDPDTTSLSGRLARYRTCPLTSPCP